MNSIGIIDYGAGNFQSVYNAIEHLGFKIITIRSNREFDSVSRIILPGVGTYQEAMKRLHNLRLVDPILEHVQDKRLPFLGICIGEQILSTLGTEFVETPGLNLIPGKTIKIDFEKTDVVLPHMGWNEVSVVKKSPLFYDLSEDSSFYFVHSYHFIPDSAELVSSYCNYGGKITATVERENVFGVQFHPEKSQSAGLQLLKNFCKL